jgi:hypothetical protein
MPRVEGCEVEAHLFVDLDAGTIVARGVEELPSWAIQLISTVKVASNAEFQFFMVNLLCHALGVQPASSHRTTAKRIRMALEANPPEPASFVGMLFQSRTMQVLLDGLRHPIVPSTLAKFLASGSVGGITSPAIQGLDEFPVRGAKKGVKKVRPMRSFSAPGPPVVRALASDDVESSSSPIEAPSDETAVSLCE